MKNEESVILRCLESLRSIADFIVVVDTGSTDRTIEIVSRHLLSRPGKLYQREWKDFAHNRSEALALARDHGDYTVIIDADDYFVTPKQFKMPHLTAGAYYVKIIDSSTSYMRLQFVDNRLVWKYRGVLHEYLNCETENTTSTLEGLTIKRNHDGARRRDATTYVKDAEILERALENESDPFLSSRYRFYLAQSYRDAKDDESAIKNYLIRAELGYWQEEIYVSLLEAARAMARSNAPYELVLKTFERATSAFPERAEALHSASFHCRNAKRFAEGATFAKRGISIRKPASGLFLEGWIYDYGLLDEFAVSSYWCNNFSDCVAACTRLLSERKMPDDFQSRIEINLKLAKEKIQLQGLLADSRKTTALDAIKSDQPAVPTEPYLSKVYIKQFSIYRQFHIVWVGDESKRPDNCIQTWKEHNPDWHIRVWGNDDLRTVRWRNQVHIENMLSRELCGVADLMRWEILHQFGGFAVDADAICVRPLPDWLFETDLFAAWENELARPGLIANGYMYSHPKNNLIAKIIENFERMQELPAGFAWQITGPQHLTDTVRNERYSNITVYPSHFFMPEHLTGYSYKGSGPIFAKQLWGRANNLYDDLAQKKLEELT